MKATATPRPRDNPGCDPGCHSLRVTNIASWLCRPIVTATACNRQPDSCVTRVPSQGFDACLCICSLRENLGSLRHSLSLSIAGVVLLVWPNKRTPR